MELILQDSDGINNKSEGEIIALSPNQYPRQKAGPQIAYSAFQSLNSLALMYGTFGKIVLF